ncbi:MAG TPA: hypothetical protein VK084_10395 [Chitinophagaceae bacterium]|nr:hypothetical protein [Chitinophagaceae bacterium]
MKTIGIILIVIGIAMIIVKEVNFQTEEQVADVGPIEINKTEDHHVEWPYYVGGIVVIGGIALTVAGARANKRKNRT